VNERKWFVGVDWGSAEHAVCLLDDTGKKLGERVFKHDGGALAEMCAWLLETSGAKEPSALHVAIETPHGPVVETMLERGMVVHSINPKQLDRFRDRFSVAGAKDDRLDAYVLADALRTDQRKFRVLAIDHPLIIEIRESSRIHADLVEERTRLSNRFRGLLLRYYPQFLELEGDEIAHDSFLSLFELLPTPAAARHAKEATVAKRLKELRIRRFDAKHVLATLRKKSLTVAPGTTEAVKAHVSVIIERLHLVNRQLENAEMRLDTLAATLASEEDASPGQKSEQHDVAILQSLPGVGRVVLAILLAEAWRLLAARDYHALRKLSGVAPVTRNSGKRSGAQSNVGMRRACNARLREAVFHWARSASQNEPKSQLAYQALRRRGKSYGAALRSVGDRLLRMACAMLRERTAYDPARRRLVTA
jgi:transposase